MPVTLTYNAAQQITSNADRWFEPLRDAALRWMIDTPPRLSCWLAQCSHESRGFSRLEEYLSYSAKRLREVWPRRFTVELAEECAHNPQKIAEVVYQNRMGNTQPGDGYLYRGRGLIMVTGRANYTECAEATYIDCANDPDLLLLPEHAADSAGWYWYAHGLNEMADAMDFERITRTINGGLTGMQDRIDRLRVVHAVVRGLA